MTMPPKRLQRRRPYNQPSASCEHTDRSTSDEATELVCLDSGDGGHQADGKVQEACTKRRQTSANSPRTALEHLQQRANRLIDAGLSDNTKLAYSNALKSFVNFRKKMV